MKDKDKLEGMTAMEIAVVLIIAVLIVLYYFTSM